METPHINISHHVSFANCVVAKEPDIMVRPQAVSWPTNEPLSLWPYGSNLYFSCTRQWVPCHLLCRKQTPCTPPPNCPPLKIKPPPNGRPRLPTFLEVPTFPLIEDPHKWKTKKPRNGRNCRPEIIRTVDRSTRLASAFCLQVFRSCGIIQGPNTTLYVNSQSVSLAHRWFQCGGAQSTLQHLGHVLGL